MTGKGRKPIFSHLQRGQGGFIVNAGYFLLARMLFSFGAESQIPDSQIPEWVYKWLA